MLERISFPSIDSGTTAQPEWSPPHPAQHTPWSWQVLRRGLRRARLASIVQGRQIGLEGKAMGHTDPSSVSPPPNTPELSPWQGALLA